MPYQPPVRDHLFLLRDVLEIEKYANLPGFADASMDVVSQIVEEAGRFTGEVLAPLNSVGDKQGCVWNPDHTVTTPAGFKQAYAQLVEGGWPALGAEPAYGGQGLPHVVNLSFSEMSSSANMAFSMYPGLTHGAYSAILNGGSDAQKARDVAGCCDEILPALAADGARFVDVFCEHGVFDLAESRRILEAGKAVGLAPRLHADELTPLGGARLAAEVGALSADHLLFAQPDGIHAMAKAGVVATLLPGTSVFLRMNRYAPAREMVSAGVAVALGTDCNPGSSYTESLPAVAFFATIGMGLTVEEALTAMTLNAAASVGEAARRGSLEPGKAADVVLVDGRNLEHLVYHYGVNTVTDVVVSGRPVVRDGRRVPGT